jgi:hypothetical protein
MQYVEAISEERAVHKSIFLAGGISGCRDWQKELVEKIGDSKCDITVFNPRRKSFDTSSDIKTAFNQIKWEFDRLHGSDIVSYWFSKETVCPLSLFELGGGLQRRHQTIVVGIDEGYTKANDVVIQIGLCRPDIKVHVGFEDFKEAVLKAIHDSRSYFAIPSTEIREDAESLVLHGISKAVFQGVSKEEYKTYTPEQKEFLRIFN